MDCLQTGTHLRAAAGSCHLHFMCSAFLQSWACLRCAAAPAGQPAASDSTSLLAAEDCWQQKTAGSRRLLAAEDCWQQKTAGSRLVLSEAAGCPAGAAAHRKHAQLCWQCSMFARDMYEQLCLHITMLWLGALHFCPSWMRKHGLGCLQPLSFWLLCPLAQLGGS